MAYATVDDLSFYLRDKMAAELSSDTGTATDDDLVAGIILGVSNEADGYLRAVTTLPITDTGVLATVKEHVLKITVYRLFLRGLISGGAVTDAAEAAKRSYAYLESVARGQISLGLVDSGTAYTEEDETLSDDSLAVGSDGGVFDGETVL